IKGYTMTNYLSSLNQTSSSRQPSHRSPTNLQQGQKVYLYDDIKYTGTLIRPVERTYPPRWTVELDQGGYDSAPIHEITPITLEPIESNLEIPFGDNPEPSTAQLEREIIALKEENASLKQENQRLTEELAEAKHIIRCAKDISPVMRFSLQRVMRLAHQACMDVQRTVGGWILKMGDKARKFRRLADIWYILSQDNFLLSEIFPPEKLIAVELILSPRPRKRPEPLEKTTKPLMRPEDVLRRRSMSLVKSG
ncbi:MAG: FtsB family cell division protein, partial [Waterburya sp.]